MELSSSSLFFGESPVVGSRDIELKEVHSFQTSEGEGELRSATEQYHLNAQKGNKNQSFEFTERR
jgi:hypothetical protein